MKLILKFQILLLTILMVSVSGIAQNVNQTDSSGKKQGPWKKNHKNGNLRYEGNFKDDKPVGVFKYYYDSGKLQATNNHLDDGISVAHHSYHVNGKIKGKGLYVNQKKDSLWQFFSDSEILVLEEIYVNEVLNGPRKSYYDKSGNLLEELNYDMGVKHGVWKKYFDNGKPWLEGNYDQGDLNGEFNIYTADGKPVHKGKYDHGLRLGRWLIYNANGSVKTQDIYAKGKLDRQIRQNGTFKDFYDDEKPKSEYTYKKGKLQGDFREWYNNGTWVKKEEKSDMEFVEQIDVVEELHGQTLKTKGRYVEDKLHGKVTHYLENGSVDRVEMYEMGELTSTIEWDDTNGK